MSDLKEIPSYCIRQLNGHTGAVMVVRLNNNGNYLYSGGSDQIIKLWNPIKGNLVFSFINGHSSEVTDVAPDSLNQTFASCGADKITFIWDIASTKITRRLRGHTHKINCVCFGGNSSILLTGSFDKTVKIWDLRARNFSAIQTLDDFKDGVSCIYTTDNEIIVSSSDGSLYTYDVRSGMVQTDKVGKAITNFVLSQDGKCAVAACLGGRIHMLERSSGDVLNIYSGHLHTQYKVECALSPNDEHIVCGSEDGDIYVYDILNSKPIKRLRKHTTLCCSLTFRQASAFGDIPLLCSSSGDGAILVWSNESQEEVEAQLKEKDDLENSTKADPFIETRKRLPLLFM